MPLRLSPAVLALALTLSACGGSDDPAPVKAAPAASTPIASTPIASTPIASTPTLAAPSLTVTGQWVKTADKGMSAAFGTLVNDTGADITVVAATTPASPMVELHEVLGAGGEMKMQPRKGGFTVPAHGRLELKPGGLHIMLMNVTEPIEPGAEIAFTLKLEDGTTVPFTALGKAFKGGNEKYAPGH
ncbi:copper chaperone PCu(A)C [Actinocorallia longicatena]|uniref:Copper chaperone PCu(A)C n=1 Tax=Actinocorallia longicatena TaxID=111803 RepID=A0ABP6Q4N1_9ACTN